MLRDPAYNSKTGSDTVKSHPSTPPSSPAKCCHYARNISQVLSSAGAFLCTKVPRVTPPSAVQFIQVLSKDTYLVGTYY